MQTGKDAGASAKKTVSNIAASAKSGMDKTTATMQEKVEKITAHDPVQKQMATEKKEAKINQAELNKLEAKEQNTAARRGAKIGGTGGTTTTTHTHTHTHPTTGVTHSTTGAAGYPTGQQQPAWLETEDLVGTQPTGTTGAHNTRASGGTNTGYGTGGTYG